MRSDSHYELNPLLEKLEKHKASDPRIIVLYVQDFVDALEQAYELGVNAEIDSSYKDGNRLHL